MNRTPGVLKLIKQMPPLCDRVYILNNSSAENPCPQVAAINGEQIHFQQQTMPDWARELLVDYSIEK